MTKTGTIHVSQTKVSSGRFTSIDRRTYIATQAMVGLLAGGVPIGDGDLIAGGAVELADALIEELNK